jgi:hypothetical protein
MKRLEAHKSEKKSASNSVYIKIDELLQNIRFIMQLIMEVICRVRE